VVELELAGSGRYDHPPGSGVWIEKMLKLVKNLQTKNEWSRPHIPLSWEKTARRGARSPGGGKTKHRAIHSGTSDSVGVITGVTARLEHCPVGLIVRARCSPRTRDGCAPERRPKMPLVDGTHFAALKAPATISLVAWQPLWRRHSSDWTMASTPKGHRPYACARHGAQDEGLHRMLNMTRLRKASHPRPVPHSTRPDGGINEFRFQFSRDAQPSMNGSRTLKRPRPDFFTGFGSRSRTRGIERSRRVMLGPVCLTPLMPASAEILSGRLGENSLSYLPGPWAWPHISAKAAARPSPAGR